MLEEHGFRLDEALLAVDTVVDLVHDGAAQVAWMHDPRQPDGLTPAARALYAHYPPRLRAAVNRIVTDPRAHLARKTHDRAGRNRGARRAAG